MFDKLLELLAQFWHELVPFIVIREYEQGIVLRLGKYNRTIVGGFHWKLPFIEEVIAEHTVPTTIALEAQSVTTSDDKSVVVRGIVKYRVSDIKTFLLDVYDAHDGISDMAQGIIKTVLGERTWLECQSPDVENMITKKIRTEAKRWGLEVLTVILTDLAIIRSIRLFSDHTHTHL